MKWFGFLAAALLVAGCCMVWVTIPSKNIIVSGIDASGTNFGRPGYFHFLCTLFFVAFAIIPRVWAKRCNLLVTALNLAWAIRNYFIITVCREGDCPVKHTGIYLVLIGSLGLMIAALFPDFRERKTPMQ